MPQGGMKRKEGEGRAETSVCLRVGEGPGFVCGRSTVEAEPRNKRI